MVKTFAFIAVLILCLSPAIQNADAADIKVPVPPLPPLPPILPLPPYLASGSGRIWKCMTLLVVPLPVSMWNGVRVLIVA